VLRKTKTKEDLIKAGQYTVEKKEAGGTNKIKNTDISARKLEEEELPVIKTVSKGLSGAIVKARVEKGWKRKDLAMQCSLQESVIADYENGKAIFKIGEVNKIGRALGIVLKKDM